MKPYLIGDKSVVATGRFIRTARLRDEYYVTVEKPDEFVAQVRASGIRADLLTIVQEIYDQTPRCSFHHETDSLAVLPLQGYHHWLNNQITFKPRNKIRKAIKSGVELRMVEFSDELVRAIMNVYNENPLRQGQRNRHYGKDFDTVKREHSTFLDRSEFIGAFYQQEMIGFVKVTHVKNYSVLMAILAMISHRDKAPTNALMAKTVETCAARNSQFLNYSTWGKREGLNEFKEAHGFQRFEIPRFFIPLTLKGKMALKWNLHRKPIDHVPAEWIKRAAVLRSIWNEFRFRHNGVAKAEKPAASVVK